MSCYMKAELYIIVVIIICAILFCTEKDKKKARDFLIIISLLIFLLFIVLYVKMNQIEMYGTENFGHAKHNEHDDYGEYGTGEYGTGEYEVEVNGQKLYENKNTTYNDGKNYSVKVGPPNRKTLVQPVMPPRSHDLEVWKKNASTVHSHINDSTGHYDDGYTGNDYGELGSQGDGGNTFIYQNPSRESHPHQKFGHTTKGQKVFNRTLIEPFVELESRESHQYINPDHVDTYENSVPIPGENYDSGEYEESSYSQTSPPPHYYRVDDENGDGVDNEKYNNQDQIQYGLPSNLSVYPRPEHRDHAREVHTQTIQPNIFSRHQVIEPINANLGVSFNGQFQHVDTDIEGKSGFYGYTRLDPQLVRDDENPVRTMENPKRNRWTKKMGPWEAESGTVDMADIYDPRFTGYGDPYRSYQDVNTGQVRYYYSDIDAYRKPNFVIKSEVQHMDFHDPMGAVKPEYHRNVINKNSRALVEDQFLRDTLSHREDIMESLMRKRNQESYQLRTHPISRGQTGRKAVF
jgi:hypothetical protein